MPAEPSLYPARELAVSRRVLFLMCMATEASEVMDHRDMESAKPCRSLRYASAEALEMLGFIYDAKIGRWVIPPRES